MYVKLQKELTVLCSYKAIWQVGECRASREVRESQLSCSGFLVCFLNWYPDEVGFGQEVARSGLPDHNWSWRGEQRLSSRRPSSDTEVKALDSTK